MYRIHQIKLSIGESKESIPRKICRKISIKGLTIKEWKIVRESLDARDKSDIRFIYSIDFVPEINGSPVICRADLRKMEKAGAQAVKTERYEIPEVRHPERLTGEEQHPVVIGFGPAGIFAALVLAQAGLKPLVLERGKDVERRTADVEKLWAGGPLDSESNVQFGEGGAGAFSDGKLTTGIKDIRIGKILEEMVRFGAPEEILYRQKPHVGTDILKTVVSNIREEILSLGGCVCFDTRVDNLVVEEGHIKALELSVRTEEGKVRKEVLNCRDAILAIGHSARDTFVMLKEKGAAMEQKPFSIGIRIEHPQEMIDISQYGKPAKELGLPPAEYKLSYRCREDNLAAGRGVYTFCMCPGGHVILASSEDGGVAVNGMSYHDRSSGIANSALLCDVRTEDFGSEDVLAGVEFQRRYERQAFRASGARYAAPEATWGDLRDGRAPQVEGCLPEFAVAALREAMPHLGEKLKGFDCEDAKVYAVETRSSSPVRILRGRDGQSLSIRGLYPCGEGAGYAGGITSAAVDGIKAAEAVIESMKNR